MIEIPECKKMDYTPQIEKAVRSVVDDFAAGRNRVTLDTSNCATGGYPMPVIMEVAHLFAKKGYFVYLVTGGAYTQPSWLDIQTYEGAEGYRSKVRFANYYQRIR